MSKYQDNQDTRSIDQDEDNKKYVLISQWKEIYIAPHVASESEAHKTVLSAKTLLSQDTVFIDYYRQSHTGRYIKPLTDWTDFECLSALSDDELERAVDLYSSAAAVLFQTASTNCKI